MTSGHLGGTGRERDVTVCDHPPTSYADNLRHDLGGARAFNFAHSGASSAAVLNAEPFTNACGEISQAARSQIADAVLALRGPPSQPARRNVSVFTTGLSDTNLLTVLLDIIADPRDAAASATACRNRIHGGPDTPAAWNGPSQSVSIADNVAAIVLALGAADPLGHVRPVLYPNFAVGDPRLPAPCAGAVTLAIGSLNQWVSLGATAGQLLLAANGGNPNQVAMVSPQCHRLWQPARNFVQDSLATSANGVTVPGYPNPDHAGRDQFADCVRASVLGAHDDPVGRQLDWLLAVSSGAAVLTPAEYAARVTPGLLAEVPYSAFVAALGARSPFRLIDVVPGSTPHQVLARVRTTTGHIETMKVIVEAGTGRIALVRFDGDVLAKDPPSQQGPLATSWNQIDARLAALAPIHGLLVGEVGPNGCTAVHGSNADNVGPVGSIFKTFILGALADRIVSGGASWDERYPVQDRHRVTQLLAGEPPGTRVPLRNYAADMIWMSDNTATDHLMARLGRLAVEAQQIAFGTTNPVLNVPFPSSREAFILKYLNFPTLVNQYLALDRPGRRALLDGPLSSIPTPLAGAPTPRAILDVEWFFTPRDLCKALAELHGRAETNPTLAPIADIMAITDAGLGLSADNWRTTWYKGGSENGVFAIAFLAEAADGRVFTVTAYAAHPTVTFDQNAVFREFKALARSALALAAGTGA